MTDSCGARHSSDGGDGSTSGARPLLWRGEEMVAAGFERPRGQGTPAAVADPHGVRGPSSGGSGLGWAQRRALHGLGAGLGLFLFFKIN